MLIWSIVSIQEPLPRHQSSWSEEILSILPNHLPPLVSFPYPTQLLNSHRSSKPQASSLIWMNFEPRSEQVIGFFCFRKHSTFFFYKTLDSQIPNMNQVNCLHFHPTENYKKFPNYPHLPNCPRSSSPMLPTHVNHYYVPPLQQMLGVRFLSGLPSKLKE